MIFDRVAIGAGALALAALVGLLAWRIVALRARPGPPPVPLDAVALASLAQADRALRRGFFAVSGLVAALVAVLAIDRSGDPRLRGAVLGAAIAVAIAAAVVQLRTRCPRCDYRFGLDHRVGVPKRCARCGVALRHDGSPG